MTLPRVHLGGQRIALDDRDLLGEGGEGRVYRRGAVAVKVFTQPSAARAAKLRAFPRSLPTEVIAPLDLCTDDRGDVVGYSMRLLDQAVDLQRYGQRKWRAGRASNADVVALLRKLAGTVDQLHRDSVVVGDLNDGNVVVTTHPRNGNSEPWLIDADSMQLPAHPCVVGHERFLDPRFYGRDLALGGVFSRETDWYALAVMAFSSLLYLHPFGGAHPSHPTLLRRAEARHSALRSDVKLPASAARKDVLSDDALGWFERVFERDAREPLPPAILDARFTACGCGTEHARARCPACAVQANVAPVVRECGKLRATRVFYKRHARVVEATFDGTLRWVSEQDGILRREDESVLTSAGPIDLVRIAGNATWIGAGCAMQKIVGGAVTEEHRVGMVHGEIAADASHAGLIHVQADTLVRADTATRVGNVLERQTHVRTGSTLGFAFYRAGGLTVAFVFDPRRGPLRQIESFPSLSGRLQGWSAVFGEGAGGADAPHEAHVLVTFALELSGKVTHRAHLLSADGRIVATDDGAILPPSLGGRAIGPRGTVLVATDGGLVLTGVDAGAFTAARCFPETKDFVSPDDDLLVGSGGSLYAVTDDEITHLCFTT